MSKKTLIIVGAILTVVVGVIAGVLIVSQKKTSNITGGNAFNKFIVPQKTDGKLTNYQDESGYSFSYLDSISIVDVTPDDDNYYSSLELKKGADTMTIRITVGNTNPYKADKSATLTGSSTMGGIAASQYKVATRLVSVAIDQGVLYVIDGPADGGFWEETQSKILSTFKFGTEAESAPADENTVYEEEVVE